VASSIPWHCTPIEPILTSLTLSAAACIQPANASASSIEKAWNLAWAEDILGTDVNKMSTVVELGGGHGQVI
jgi:hypothetical protein